MCSVFNTRPICTCSSCQECTMHAKLCEGRSETGHPSAWPAGPRKCGARRPQPEQYKRVDLVPPTFHSLHHSSTNFLPPAHKTSSTHRSDTREGNWRRWATVLHRHSRRPSLRLPAHLSDHRLRPTTRPSHIRPHTPSHIPPHILPHIPLHSDLVAGINCDRQVAFPLHTTTTRMFDTLKNHIRTSLLPAPPSCGCWKRYPRRNSQPTCESAWKPRGHC